MSDAFQFQRAFVVDVGDVHAGSIVGPCVAGFMRDNGDPVTPNKQQRWLNKIWSEFWERCYDRKRELDWPTFVILKGELADDNKHAKTALVSPNTDDLLGMGLELLQPAIELADYVIVIRGTEAHSGPESWMDEHIASDIQGVEVVQAIEHEDRFTHYNWRGKLGGVLFDVAHHPGHGSMREWTKGGDANRLAADIALRYIRYNKGVVRQGQPEKQIDIPDLVLRGHNHNPSDSSDNHPVRAIIGPGWQLMGSFGYRLGGRWLPVGGNTIECNRGSFTVDKHHWYWPMEGYWTVGASA